MTKYKFPETFTSRMHFEHSCKALNDIMLVTVKLGSNLRRLSYKTLHQTATGLNVNWNKRLQSWRGSGVPVLNLEYHPVR